MSAALFSTLVNLSNPGAPVISGLVQLLPVGNYAFQDLNVEMSGLSAFAAGPCAFTITIQQSSQIIVQAQFLFNASAAGQWITPRNLIKLQWDDMLLVNGNDFVELTFSGVYNTGTGFAINVGQIVLSVNGSGITFP